MNYIFRVGNSNLNLPLSRLYPWLGGKIQDLHCPYAKYHQSHEKVRCSISIAIAKGLTKFSFPGPYVKWFKFRQVHSAVCERSKTSRGGESSLESQPVSKKMDGTTPLHHLVLFSYEGKSIKNRHH